MEIQDRIQEDWRNDGIVHTKFDWIVSWFYDKIMGLVDQGVLGEPILELTVIIMYL